jgi:hypothetical protein
VAVAVAAAVATGVPVAVGAGVTFFSWPGAPDRVASVSLRPLDGCPVAKAEPDAMMTAGTSTMIGIVARMSRARSRGRIDVARTWGWLVTRSRGSATRMFRTV